MKKHKVPSFLKLTFWSLKWRSLKPWKGPNEVTTWRTCYVHKKKENDCYIWTLENQTAASIRTSSKLSFHSALNIVIHFPNSFFPPKKTTMKFRDSVCNTLCFFWLKILLVGWMLCSCKYIYIYLNLIFYQPAFVDAFRVESLHISPFDGMVMFDEVIMGAPSKSVFLGNKWTTTLEWLDHAMFGSTSKNIQAHFEIFTSNTTLYDSSYISKTQKLRSRNVLSQSHWTA